MIQDEFICGIFMLWLLCSENVNIYNEMATVAMQDVLSHEV